MRSAGKVAHRIRFTLIGLFCLCYAGMALAEPNIREGLWEITIKMEMAGKPGDTFPQTTQTLCLTDKNKLPELLQKDQNCQIKDTKTEGSEASWKMRCQGQGNVITGSGRITYRGDRFDGAIHIRMQQADAEPMKLTQRIEGRRRGECP